MANTEIRYSGHAQVRLFSRSFSRDDIKNCVRFGTKLHRTGIRFYILREKDIIENSLPERLSGLCVLVAGDGTVITAYKNRNAIRYTKKLSKEDLRKFH